MNDGDGVFEDLFTNYKLFQFSPSSFFPYNVLSTEGNKEYTWQLYNKPTNDQTSTILQATVAKSTPHV